MGIRRKIIESLLPMPVLARHVEYSLIASADDDVGPSERLLDIAHNAIERSRQVSLFEISDRIKNGPRYPDVWPGEHYKLLAALVAVMQPKLVIEIGTATGSSALALAKFLSEGAQVVTFDVVPWQQYPEAILEEADFAGGRLRQIVSDLTDASQFSDHRNLIAQAELIFVDAAKDGIMEQSFIDLFSTVSFALAPIIVFDDIRVWNMLKIWRGLRRPKLDLTSFGHWSGTGLVDWS